MLFVTTVFAESGHVLITHNGTVNVRKASDKNSQKVGSAYSGSTYEYLEIASNGWYKIRLDDGTIGYISGKMAKVVDVATEEKTADTETVVPESTAIESTTKAAEEVVNAPVLSGDGWEITAEYKYHSRYSSYYNYMFVLKNTSGEDSDISVQVLFYDKSGNILGVANQTENACESCQPLR